MIVQVCLYHVFFAVSEVACCCCVVWYVVVKREGT